MRPVFLALGLVLLGAAALTASAQRPSIDAAAGLGLAVGAVLTSLGIIALATALRRRGKSSAVLQLNVFLPFLKKRKKNVPPAARALAVLAAKRVLPHSFFSDPETGKPGRVRKALKKIGPTVHSAPLRRAVQAVCLVLFLVLFFFVCWPYTAAPALPGRSSAGWRFVAIDPASATYHFEGGASPKWPLKHGMLVYVAPAEVDDSSQPAVPFDVVIADATRASLLPREPLSPEQIDAFLLGTAPWTFHESAPGSWPSHYADDLARKEKLPAEVFLAIDPLVSLSTAVASRSWVWSLASAGVILIVCVLIPRGFCGYLCPLGTLIDLFDWAVGRRVTRFRVSDEGWWVHIKYYLLLGVMVCAVLGVLVSGYVAAIPVITRGMLFLGEPAQSGVLREWRLIPPISAGHIFSIALFFAVLGLGLLKPRFWCKYVCPSGAVFSLGNLFRVTERKVESTCINCNKCVEICPFDAIKPDFTTRVTDCTLCQTCGGVCPTHAIKFVERWNQVELKIVGDPPTHETALGRRGFLSLAAGTAAAAVSGAGLAMVTKGATADASDPGYLPPIRPPGSVPEPEFLQMCIRCGECFKACPNNVLQPMGLGEGLNNLWTPKAAPDWAGCEPSCNACGQVCPTGAIRALALVEKKAARMGLAVVNQSTCLPFAGREACQLCVDECAAAGYNAIEFTQVHTQVDSDGQPLAGTGFLAPVVLADKCVGCGICQTRCYGINKDEKGLLEQSAIIIEAGEGKEDRLMGGSYVQLREEEARRRAAERVTPARGGDDYFIPIEAPTSQQPRGESENRPLSPENETPF